MGFRRLFLLLGGLFFRGLFLGYFLFSLFLGGGLGLLFLGRDGSLDGPDCLGRRCGLRRCLDWGHSCGPGAVERAGRPRAELGLLRQAFALRLGDFLLLFVDPAVLAARRAVGDFAPGNVGVFRVVDFAALDGVDENRLFVEYCLVAAHGAAALFASHLPFATAPFLAHVIDTSIENR